MSHGTSCQWDVDFNSDYHIRIGRTYAESSFNIECIESEVGKFGMESCLMMAFVSLMLGIVFGIMLPIKRGNVKTKKQ